MTEKCSRRCMLGLLGSATGLLPAASSEAEVKAAMLYNFLKFVEWNPTAARPVDSVFVIGLFAGDSLAPVIERTVSGKLVLGRPVTVREIESVQAGKAVHVLFLRQGVPAVRELVQQLHKFGTLTVSDAPRFMEAGGVIQFTVVENRVRFMINQEAALKAGLKISSRLLALSVPGRGEGSQ
ncbi:MAG: YfiR family protein [Acidobacteria bacterium]|nr:YfiR family protein [Acidobacteriota bacterium]